MKIQRMNVSYNNIELQQPQNKQIAAQKNYENVSKNITMPNIANNYFSHNISFGNKFANFVTDNKQNLFLELTDKYQKADSVSIVTSITPVGEKEGDLVVAESKIRNANGKFSLPVDFFDRIDNAPLDKVALKTAVFFDAKGNTIETLEVAQPNTNAETSSKIKRTVTGEEPEYLNSNIVFSPRKKQEEVNLKSVSCDGFESKENVEIFSTAKTEGKIKEFELYDDLKTYDGENVIAILGHAACEAMFNDLIMSAFSENYDDVTLNENFFLPISVKGVIVPMMQNITSLFSGLGHVRARLQNRQSVLFTPETFTTKLKEHYSADDKIKMTVFPTGLKIEKTDNYSEQDSKVVLNKPQYVDRLMTFDDSSDLYNEASAGVKANNLRLLSQHAKELGVKIPETFVIPAGFVQRMGLDLDEKDKTMLDEVYNRSLAAQGEEKVKLRTILQETLGEMQSKILNKPIPDDCKRELEQMLKKTGLDKNKGIVRSSMNGEDNKNLQTAGLYDSLLFDGIEEFWDSMKQVVASKWSLMAYLSRMQNDIPHDDVSVNMPVQQLVDGDYIGTAYTADARTGDKNKLIVQMAPGIDCGIAGTPYTFVTDILSGDVDRTLARKMRKKPLYLMSKSDVTDKRNYEATDYSRDFWNKSADEYRPQLRKINNVLKKIRNIFGGEQDVEFIIKFNRDNQKIATGIQDIYIVQTRDIKM